MTKVNRGEIFVPKMKLFNVKELALKISKKHKIIGPRQGEKLQEILITEDEKKISQEKSRYVDHSELFIGLILKQIKIGKLFSRWRKSCFLLLLRLVSIIMDLLNLPKKW